MMGYNGGCGGGCGGGNSGLAELLSSIGLAGLAAFFFLLVWTIYVACTSLTDWWWVSDPSTGIHEGLWVICYNTNCLPNSEYLGGCFALLNVLRGFCILSIILGFFTFVLCVLLMYPDWDYLYPPALVLAFLTMCCSIVPWTTFLGFVQQCVTGEFAYPSYYPSQYGYPTIYGQGSAFPSVTKGSGWCLSIAAFVFAYVGMLLLFGAYRRHEPAPCGMPCAMPCGGAMMPMPMAAPAATGMMTYPSTPMATPALATPMYPAYM